MSARSFAARAVADGPATVAPPSFDGHGWLVVINLAMMTAAFVLATMMVVDLIRHVWRRRRTDRRSHPVTLWRLTILCFAVGIAVRSMGAAAVLWGWNPLQPGETATLLLLQRLLDPIALAAGLTGLALAYVSAPGMVWQLRRRPFPIDFWTALPLLKRPAIIVALSAIAAIGVVVTR
ncbi:hypothetical protein [Sphingomonas sp. Leaf4]|uniref:hypothetical protein n=1 Tax=Sphingomonas sp. Leaf4 TaxID=2876553 RepID=UPI001E4E6897|nr:hypothetical protein [Sphingomonas sp. Leaf4]